MNILDAYIEGVKNTYIKNNKEAEWNNFINNRKRINENILNKLIEKNIPSTLIELYKYMDGSDIILFGSDMENVGYLLNNTNVLLENNRFSNDFFINMHKVNRDSIDNKILPIKANTLWLHFASSIDNGRTSELYIDLSPSRFGTFGQIIRYKSEPNEFKVIATSFDTFLNNLKNNNFNFIK